MSKLSNHENYNCRAVTDSGDEFLLYANWLHNNHQDSWQGWQCQAGSKRLLIDKDLQVYGGECKNDHLGTTDNFRLLESTLCGQLTCTGCTDDLMVEKHAPQSNIAKGVKSYDAQVGNITATFFNRNTHEYPVEVGAPSFAPIPVEKEKDISVNVARSHAKQEYERIMEIVEVLQDQAKKLKGRLDCTELVHACEYSMRVTHDKTYYVYFNTFKNQNILALTGPVEWSTGVPDHWQFVAAVRRKGDSTWEYEDDSNGMDGGAATDGSRSGE